MTPSIQLAVLVSTSRHAVSGLPCPSRNDSLALEIGRELSGGAFKVLHAGDPTDPALAHYLAYGARSVDVLPAGPDDDIVPMLVPELRETHLILCGCRSQTGGASGMLPYLLGAAMNRPVMTDILNLKLRDLPTDRDISTEHDISTERHISTEPDALMETEQFLPKGRRRHVDIPLPAIVAIHPLAPVVPHYAYARRVAGSIRTLPTTTPHDTGAAGETDDHSGTQAGARSAIHPDSDASAWLLEPEARAPVRLKAPDRRSGHARMLAATGSSHQGGRVVNDGSSVAKAQAVLTYLREHQLIDF